MPQSLSRIILHLIFSTKRRQPWLSDRTLRSEMQGVLRALCNSLQGPLVLVGGVESLVQSIRNQEEHHRQDSFQDELWRILARNNLEWDERSLWD